MKKYLLLVILFSLCFMQRGERWKNRLYQNPNAGNRDKLELQQISDEAKMLFYQTEKISPENAFLYQFALPLPFVNLGYAYSDNWGKGIKWDLAILACLAKLEHIDWGNDFYYYDDDGLEIGSEIGDKNQANLYKGIVLGITMFKLFDSYKSAEKYNNQLFKRVFKRKRPSFAFDYSLNNNTTELMMSYPLN